MNRLLVLVLAALGAQAGSSADVTYQESFVTSVDFSTFMPALFNYPYGGGTLFDQTDYALAPFDPNAPANFLVVIKGDKLARLGLLSSVIYDLGRGTVTRIDRTKHSYTVLTFAQMQKKLDKGPRCGAGCQVRIVEQTGRRAEVDGIEASAFEISAMTGKKGQEVYLSHASYWTVPDLPSVTMMEFVKTCNDKFAEFSEVCALSQSDGFGVLGAATKGLKGYVVARVIETRSRAAGHGLARLDPGHEPWNVDTGPTPAQIRRTETRISNVVEGDVDDIIFAIPVGFKETKH